VASGKAHYSGGQTDAAIGDGVQDRLSVFLQLGPDGRRPEKYPPGTLIELTTSSARSAVRWQFRVGASEALELPFGSVMALRLDKLPGKSSSDQRGSVWLAPSMQYLPVRIKLTRDRTTLSICSSRNICPRRNSLHAPWRKPREHRAPSAHSPPSQGLQPASARAERCRAVQGLAYYRSGKPVAHNHVKSVEYCAQVPRAGIST
jgi:hypothetical protein